MSKDASTIKDSARGRFFVPLIVVSACIVALCIFLGVFFTSNSQKSEEVLKGIAFLKERESAKADDAVARIREKKKENKAAQIDDLLKGLEDGSIDVWSLYDDSVILGDSRAEAIVEWGFLPAERVYAQKGASVKYAAEGIDTVSSVYPDNLIFTYGVNDVDGNWSDVSKFIAAYEELVEAYKEKLPQANVFLCSVIPVMPAALEEDSNYEKIPEYTAAIKELCEKKGYFYIDCDVLYDDYKELYEKEGVHFLKDMNPVWAKVMMEEVLKGEKELYGNN